MAGSYKHCVDDNGFLLDWESLSDMLENGGDVFEAVEEMYGMIWFLAGHREDPRMAVEQARQNYSQGIAVARRLTPPVDAR